MALELLSVAPSYGSALGAGQSIEFDLRTPDASPIVAFVVALEFASLQGLREVVFSGADPAAVVATPRYAGSTVTPVVDAGFNRWHFSLNVRGLWQGSPTLHVFGVNDAGDLVTPAAPQGSWVILNPPATSPFQPLPPNAPLVGSEIRCVATFFDQAHFIETLRNSYPESYFSGIETKPNGGFEIFQASAKVAERVSVAISRLECCGFIFTAHGGAKATGSVEFFRESAADGPISLLPGTRVSAAASGRVFITTTQVDFDGVELGPKAAQIEAVATGYEYNVPGQLTTAGNELLAGEIDTIQIVVAQDDNIDRHMSVRQTAPTQDGRSACLDALGEDLDIPRLVGESDAEYRVRILEVPDTVSPNAICRGVDKALAAFDYGCCLREVGTLLLPGLYYDAGSSQDAPQVPATNFAYDMDFAQRPEDRFKLVMSVLESRAFFMVGVPTIIRAQYGFTYDGSDADPNRLENAYDTDGASDLSACYDGATELDSRTYQAVWKIVEQKRAGGVGFDLYIEDVGCF